MVADIYERMRVAVDAVLITLDEGKLKVLLCVREREPYKGRKELPGTLLRAQETVEEALGRKLEETLGADQAAAYFTQFKAFSKPKRDPRERTLGIGCVALVDNTAALRLQSAGSWFPLDNLPPLAFDHNEIVAQARSFLARTYSPALASGLITSPFKLNELQLACELMAQETFDNRNFRKKLLHERIVIPTKAVERAVSHRPAQLYRIARGGSSAGTPKI